MSLFDEKAFEFLVEPENWEVAVDISEKVAHTKARLLEEFWEAVRAGIERTLDGSTWGVSLQSTSHISCITHSWKNILELRYQDIAANAFWGVLYDFDSAFLTGDLFQELCSRLIGIDVRIKSESRWPGWFYLGYDFRLASTFTRILPSSRDDLVKHYVELFVEMKNKVVPVIDEVLRKISPVS